MTRDVLVHNPHPNIRMLETRKRTKDVNTRYDNGRKRRTLPVTASIMFSC